MQPGQYWTSSYYAGISTVLLVAVAIRRERNWQMRVLAAIQVLGLGLAPGHSGLLYRWLRPAIPGTDR